MSEDQRRKSLVAETRDLNSGLTLSEVLHLLRPKVEPGRDIPDFLSYPPWRVPIPPDDPSDSVRASVVVNSVLSESMKIQSSRIPGSGDFEDYILSNSCLAVSGLLQYYLRFLGIETSVVFGIMLWDPSARSGPDDYEGTPHLWLEVDGFPIDNSYVAIPLSELEYFYRVRRADSYVKESPLLTKLRLYLGQDESGGVDTTNHNLRVYRDYSGPGSIEKYLYFALKNAELNPCVRMYDILMRDFFRREFEVNIPDLERKWDEKCWGSPSCPKDDNNDEDDGEIAALKTCGGCKLAKYCGVQCQSADWKIHKILHKELKLTKEILQYSEAEEAEMKRVKDDILAKKAALDNKK